MTAAELVVAAIAVAVGACLQGSVGFGFGTFAAPLLAIVDRDLVPGPLLVLALLLTIMVAVRDRQSLDLHGVRWAVVGRLPGTAIGVLAIAALPERGLTVLFGVLVLVACGLSLSGWHVRPTVPNLVAAGMASGIMGTATSIGGPPVAIVYQGSPGALLRGTLAGFFVVGASVSVAGLALVGELGGGELAGAAILVVPMLAGFAVSADAARYLDAGRTRPAVLTMSVASSLFLLARELL